MKFLKGVLVVLCVLIVLVFVGAYFFLKSFDVNKYRQQIAAQISQQIGRDVRIANIQLNLSLFKGVYAQVVDLIIGEDAGFGTEDFVSVGAVKLNVDVMAYLSRREIVISRVVVENLKINVIRDGAGVINVQKIGPAPAQGTASSQPAHLATVSTASVADVKIPNFSVKTITIENAAVLFVDKSQKPALQIPISQVNITITDFSLNKLFTFEGQLAVFGDDRNLLVSGQAMVDAVKQTVSFSSVQTDFDLNKLKIDDLLKGVPQLEAAGLQGQLAGKIAVQVPSLTAGALGLGTMSATGKLSDGKISTKMLPVAIDKISADFTVDAKNVDINSFSLQLATGMVSGKAKIIDYLMTQGLDLQMKAISLPLASLVDGLPEGITVAGGLNANMTLTGQHLADSEKFLNSLNGSGQFDIKNGQIEKFNLLKIILSRISFIPGLATAVEANMPEKYREDYRKDVTLFQRISSSIQITNGTVNLPDFLVLADLFEANIQIQADALLNGKVAGQVKLPVDLSGYLASQAQPLTYLKDNNGQIVIPLTSFEGSLTKLKILPDVKSLGTTAVKEEGLNQLNKLLNKALKTDEVEGTVSSSGEGSAPAPENELINGVLNKIFK